MLAGVQSGRQPAMSNRKFSSTRCPAWVCSTSGCHCTPASPRAVSSNAAIGAPALPASAVKPAGAAATESPWLIQTRSDVGTSASRWPGVAMVGLGPAELTQPGLGHVPAKGPGHRLEPVADAERRYPGREQVGVDLRCAGRVHRLRPAGQDDRLGPPGGDLGHRGGVRHDLGVDPRLAYAAGDQLGVLGAEVDHHDQVVVGMAHRRVLLDADPESAESRASDVNPMRTQARPAPLRTRIIPVITVVKVLGFKPWLGAIGRPACVPMDCTSTNRWIPSRPWRRPSPSSSSRPSGRPGCRRWQRTPR